MANMSKNVYITLLFFLLFLNDSYVEGGFPNVPQCQAKTTHCIFVDPNKGHNDTDCLKTTSNIDVVACKNLSFAFNASYRSNHTVYVLSNGTHDLETVVGFSALNNISFIGKGIRETTIQCVANQSGLSFEGVSNLHFTNLSVSNCSSIQNSTSVAITSHRTQKISVALYFYRCENLTMNSVRVHHSPAATGVIVYDTIGENVFSHSEFSDNAMSYLDSGGGGGGGFYVEFTYCIPGSTNCTDEKVSYTNRNHNSNYAFENCVFEDNVAHDLSHTSYLVPYHSNHVAFGRGGGLSVFFKGNANNNTLSVQNCRFENNIATWGAGLFVEFHDDTYDNHVTIKNCSIVDNHCPFTTKRGTAGGGMRLGHYVFGPNNYSSHETSLKLPNCIKIDNCTFSNNSALNGGGLSISPTVQNVNKHQIAEVLINTTHFNGNYARLGAALHISKFAMILDGDILQVTLQGCEFEYNSDNFVKYLHTKENTNTEFHAYQPGLGAMYVNQVPVVFLDSVTFENNYGSALVAIGSSLDFSDCFAHFYSNQGINGGAIALLGLAWIRINDKTKMVFGNNIATIDGGAIYNRYIEREDLVTYSNCFIRHREYKLNPSDWKSLFFFFYNFDRSGNRTSGIFSTSILPCAWNSEKFVDRVFCWNDYWIYEPSNCTNHTRSGVGNIEFFHSSNFVQAFPGRQFKIPIKLSDDLSRDLGHQNVFSASLNDYSNHSLLPQYIWRQETAISDQVGNSPKVLLLDSIGDPPWHVVLKIKLEECPPGLIFYNLTLRCICRTGSYSGAVVCDIANLNPYLQNNAWMGKIGGHGEYLTGLCPPQYCFSDESVSITNSSAQLDPDICLKYSRTGILCGQCISNFSVAVNKPYYKCVNCTGENVIVNRIKYVAAIYIPLALLFSLIIVFNIRLTSAPANAFILFSQVVSSTFDLNADGQLSYLTITGNTYASSFMQACQFVYGIFNLEFIEQFLEPLCVGDINSLESISLDYVVAFFPLLMILLILICYKLWSCVLIPFCRCCQIQLRIAPRRRANLNQAMLPAFAAFALLSYNKFSQTSALLVGSQPLVSHSGEHILNETGLRVYFGGSYSYYDPEYQNRFLIPACLVFGTFVAIPPILLLDFPVKFFEKVLRKIGFLWRRYPVTKVHILLDTFQGCFKNNMRIFAGLYFLFRLAVNTSYNLTNSWLIQYLFQQLLCLVMVALLVICQPYNKENKIFNVIDPLIFLNLGALNIISFYLLSVSPSPQNTLTTAHNSEKYVVVQFILLLLPLAYILSFLVWYFLKPYAKKLKLKILKRKTKQRQVNFDSISNIVSSQQIESSEESDEEEALLKRAESCNTYRARNRTLVAISREQSPLSEEQEISSDSGLRSTRTTSSRLTQTASIRSKTYGSLRNDTSNSSQTAKGSY